MSRRRRHLLRAWIKRYCNHYNYQATWSYSCQDRPRDTGQARLLDIRMKDRNSTQLSGGAHR
jgi:hypothetical protein